MANPAEKSPAPAPQPYAPLAALLSYLVPGLGQIVQGRVGKGFLFMACIYTLFFYGLFLGRGTVSIASAGETHEKTYHVSGPVYLPSAADRRQENNAQNNPYSLPQVVVDLYNRPQFIGQFWMGVVVWPAIIQYATRDPNRPAQHPLLGDFMATPSVEALNAVHTSGSKLLDLGWVYTVIAGVLNIMVIYDALAGPAHPQQPDKNPSPKPEAAT
jgi:hypothetical protein